MITKNRIKEIFSSPKNIAVLGDVMIDEYLWGKVGRISPEAPVPIVEIDKEHLRPGGSANVANNLIGLQQNVFVFGVTGKDRMADELQNLLNKEEIDVNGLIEDESRPTTVKTRIIGGSQHIARVDKESTGYISGKTEEKIFQSLKEKISGLNAVIIEDYNKGVLTTSLIENVIALCNKNNVMVTVDPKFNNFFSFKNVTLFKPNKKEAGAVLNYDISDEKNISRGGKELLERLRAESVLVTLGSKGMALFTENEKPFFLPTQVKDVADVSGAGDTVISTLTAVLAGGGSAKEAVTIANIAAGIACTHVGVVSVTVDEILNSMGNMEK
ncbi:MAG: D-glycero-beta-D-manno-heptose-7-phosphate kinase [Calditrichia bacterium]|nr:D-glycero-beta-D-manno-heptose-7-phosphate kinase [Calditrichia bacterium]